MVAAEALDVTVFEFVGVLQTMAMASKIGLTPDTGICIMSVQ